MATFFNTLKGKKFFIFLLGFLLYAYTISFDYAQDDSIVIVENMFTEKGISGIPGIFKYDTFYGFFKEAGKDQLVQGGRYRPATLVTFALEKSIFGKNPHISHFINALLYGLLCLVLFNFCKRYFSRDFDIKFAEIFPFVIAVLFAVHPIHTEVVANIKGRDEIFVALFSLLSILFLVRENRSVIDLLLGLFFALIAFFSKENAIVLMVILPLSVWFFARNWKNEKQIWISMLAVVLVGGFYLAIRSAILGSGISGASLELMNNPFLKYDGTKMIPYTMEEKWSTIIYNLGKYLQLITIPYPLTSDYYPYHITAKSFTNFWVIASIIAHVSLIYFAISGFVKRKKWAFGIILYFGFLALVSNVPFNIGTNISERFLFVPSIGLLISLVYFILKLLGKRSVSLKIPTIIFLLVASIFSFYTISRSMVWKDDFTLLTSDVHNSPNSAKALHGAAGALSTASANEKNEDKKREMILLSNEYLARALEIYPLYANPYLIMGNNYYYLEDFEKAIKSYENLLKLYPEHVQGLGNLKVVLRDAGRFYGEKKGDLVTSVKYLTQSFNMDPNDYETIRLLGVSHGVGGNHQKAIEYFEKAVQLKPEEAFAWFNLGKAYEFSGNLAKAQEILTKAIQIDPEIVNKNK